MKKILVTLPFGFTLVCSNAFAHNASEDWQTLDTKHFAFHFQNADEAWTRRTAAQAESVFSELATLTRNDMPDKIDVIVSDPINSANGLTFATPGRPQIVLFTTPPLSNSIIGNYRDWSDLLIKHELVHAFHLARENRSAWRALLSKVWLPFAVLDRSDIPGWAVEGYATYLEGKLTGSGRPHSDLVSSLLRELALQGRLPPYNEIASHKWLGGTLNYLVGAAFYQWLETRQQSDLFAPIWQRLNAKQSRDFDSAFAGVFSETPEVLYQRFSAEITHAALSAEKQFATHEQQGQLWQRMSGPVSGLSVSPDGKRIAFIERRPERAGVLKIVALDDNQKAFDEWQKKRDELLKNDPEDIAAVRPLSLDREALFSFSARENGEVFEPRWIDDKSMLFTLLSKDSDGNLHGDLFRWQIESEQLQQITDDANVWRASASHDGQLAIALQLQHGQSRLVRVDLNNGTITPITSNDDKAIYDYPVLSHNGQMLLYLKHQDQRWQLMLRDLAQNTERVLKVPENGSYISYPSFADHDRSVVFTIGDRGYINIAQIDLQSGVTKRLTQSVHPSFSAVTIPNSNAFMYLRFDHRGFDIYRSEAKDFIAADYPYDPEWPAVITPQAAPQKTTDTIAVTTPTYDYGTGPQYGSLYLGLSSDVADTRSEIGARGGDPIGRSDWLVALSQSHNNSASGALASATWRALPVTLSATLYQQDRDSSKQYRLENPLPDLGDEKVSGALIRGDWQRYFDNVLLDLDIAALQRNGDQKESWWIHQGSLSVVQRRGDWRWKYGANWRLAHEKENDFAVFDRTVFAGIKWPEWEFGLEWRKMSTDDDRPVLHLGGSQNSVFASALDPTWISDPSLVYYNNVGDEFERQSLTINSFPSLFYRRQRLNSAGLNEQDWQTSYGFELDSTVGNNWPIPEFRNLSFTLGAAKVDDHGQRDQRAWFSIYYRW